MIVLGMEVRLAGQQFSGSSFLTLFKNGYDVSPFPAIGDFA